MNLCPSTLEADSQLHWAVVQSPSLRLGLLLSTTVNVSCRAPGSLWLAGVQLITRGPFLRLSTLRPPCLLYLSLQVFCSSSQNNKEGLHFYGALTMCLGYSLGYFV